MLSSGWHHLHAPIAPPAVPAETVGYTGPIYHGIDYNPTWPNWTSIKPHLTKVRYVNAHTIDFKSNIPLTPDQFVGDHLYNLDSKYFFAKSTIASMTANSLTIKGPEEFRPDVKNQTIVIATDQLSDSDFANSSFAGLWGTASTGQGRNDLATIAGGGYNLVRLYNWGPSRGWESGEGTAHRGFLAAAGKLGMQVQVPVSNYFLGSDEHAWGEKDPNATYSFGSAPPKIREALKQFIDSIMVSDRISPVVQSITIGNEIDLGINTEPSTTSKLQRALWWVVNLHDQLVKMFGADAPHPLLTIPVSNADQDPNGSNLSWFEAFINGVKAGQLSPNGSVPGGRFTADVTGLDAYPWYTSWYFNSYQTYHSGQALTELLQQYDIGGTTGGDWSKQWPGQKFSVPVMLTELGYSRLNAKSEAAQVNIVADQQAQVIENYLKSPGPHYFMGYDIFEFNDEPNKNNETKSAPFADALFGIFKYYASQDKSQFRDGRIQYSLKTGETKVHNANWADLQYPVYQLNPVQADGISLYDKLKSIFAEK
jgi:hypothetical protein